MPKAAMQFLYHELVNTVPFTIRDVTSEYSRVLHSSCGPTPLWSGGAHCADTKGIRSRWGSYVLAACCTVNRSQWAAWPTVEARTSRVEPRPQHRELIELFHPHLVDLP